MKADVDVQEDDNKVVSDNNQSESAVNDDSKAANYANDDNKPTNNDSKVANDDSKPTNNGSKAANDDSKTSLSKEKSEKSSVFVKIGLIGDASVGKTTLMVKYIENKFDEVYIETLGVNFMEKMVTLKSTDITFSLWDLGGRQEFITMLPLVCIDSVAFFFIFDLSRKSTLLSVKEWYRQARGLNKNAHCILIGNKYDIFTTLPIEEQEEITLLAKKYAKAMRGIHHISYYINYIVILIISSYHIIVLIILIILII